MKVLVIGLDGATFTLIKPWANQLPTLKKVMAEGTFCELVSTIPPVSSPAWPSFMTGKNPGKHGVFDFVGSYGSYEREIKNSKDIKARTLWSLLSEEERTCIVLNVPVTYPPEVVRGCIVTGMLTPPEACFAYPTEMYKALQERDYHPVAKIRRSALRPRETVNDLIFVARRRFEAFTYLMDRFDWDFGMIVFTGTDTAQHDLWQFHREEIFKLYQVIDSLIGEVMGRSGKGTNLFIMSDHGFGPVHKFFHANSFLHRRGFVEFKRGATSGRYLNIKDSRPSSPRLGALMLKMGITKETVYTWARRIRALTLLRRIYGKAGVDIPTTKRTIDWSKTKAFFNSSIGATASIQINLEGREPEGIVRKEEYERLRDVIISELLVAKDPNTDKRIVEDAFRREDVYHGRYTSEAPDIIFLTKRFEYAATDRMYGSSLVSNPIHSGRGGHRMNGILMAFGPDIQDKGERKPARILDLAPTILHMYNAGIPTDMDGKVLIDIFKPESGVSKRSVRRVRPIRLEETRVSERIKRLRRAKRL